MSKDEEQLLARMVNVISNQGLRKSIEIVLPTYKRVARNVIDKTMHLRAKFIFGKRFNLHPPISELQDEVELARAKLLNADGSTMTIELHGVSGQLYGFCSRDSRVANLYRNPFEIIWIKSIYDPTKPNPKVVAARRKYLPELDLEPLGWERRSKTSLELIDIDGKEYIMLWEKEEEILLGNRGKVYRYNVINEDNLGVITAEQLKAN